jgi:hypothetical protein
MTLVMTTHLLPPKFATKKYFLTNRDMTAIAIAISVSSGGLHRWEGDVVQIMLYIMLLGVIARTINVPIGRPNTFILKRFCRLPIME